jgi:hypothetical protein
MSVRSLLAAVLAAAALTACGGGAAAPTSPEPPTGETQTVTGSVAPYDIASHLIQVTHAGTLTITTTWTGGSDLDLYLTRDDCTGYPPDACRILVRSTASSGNQEKIQWTAAAGDRYKIWIDNFSTTAGVDYTITTEVH